jgi:hypothetical protein
MRRERADSLGPGARRCNSTPRAAHRLYQSAVIDLQGSDLTQFGNLTVQTDDATFVGKTFISLALAMK